MKRVLFLSVLLLGCGDTKKITQVLPAVPEIVDPSTFVTCHDYEGKKPDKSVQRARAESGRPDYCFIGEVCFFNCPR